MPFTSCGGCLRDIFITEAEIIDRYVGNQLWTWGRGNSGRLGDNTGVSKSSPVQTISRGLNWVQSSGGTDFTSAIKTDGTLWMWGSGSNGKLGNNSVVDRSSPVQTVSAGTNWKQVSSGINFTSAIKADGTLWSWGGNGGGRLGDNTNIDKSSPVQTVSAGTNWKQVSAGKNDHTAAIKTDGTLWLWGNNTTGKLGNNATANISSPVQTVAAGNNWKQVSLGFHHSAAVKTDGTLWVWGCNNAGQLGISSVQPTSSPVQTVSTGTNWKQVNLSLEQTAAIKTDGTLWLWGNGGSGRLGNNSQANQSSPVQIVSGGTNWKHVSTGDAFGAAIKTDGTLWTWGTNSDGQLGNNVSGSVSSPVQTISGGTNWKDVCVGDVHVSAVTHTEL